MEIVFLGTGAAWGLPEHTCSCAICAKMRDLGEHRTRTGLFIRGQERLMIDCGPDIRSQMMIHDIELPDAVIITHEHGDHFLGLDELLAFRRRASCRCLEADSPICHGKGLGEHRSSIWVSCGLPD